MTSWGPGVEDIVTILCTSLQRGLQEVDPSTEGNPNKDHYGRRTILVLKQGRGLHLLAQGLGKIEFGLP